MKRKKIPLFDAHKITTNA